MKKFEYREPEFKVVVTNAQDILTASESGGILNTIADAWDTGSSGAGEGGIGFSL